MRVGVALGLGGSGGTLTLVAGSGGGPAARVTASKADHYSLTSAFESNFGLPLLGAAPGVTPAPIT